MRPARSCRHPRAAFGLDDERIEFLQRQREEFGVAGELVDRFLDQPVAGVRKGDEGFGEGNFTALFESMERDQLRRGVLEEVS